MKLETRPLKDYEDRYSINTYGVIHSIPRLRIDAKGRRYIVKGTVIKARIDERSGYLIVKITKPDGSYGSQYVHRLVALTFLLNPYNKEFVDHINGKKTDATLKNLRWVTRSENQKLAIQNKLARVPNLNHTPVINTCTGVIYPSMTAAAIGEGCSYEEVKRVVSLKQSTNSCLRKVA